MKRTVRNYLPVSKLPCTFTHWELLKRRHNVEGVSSEPLRECDSGLSTQGGGGVPVNQVGVGWVCTIVNGAGVPWLKCALHKDITWISGVNMDSKNFGATCEGRA